MAHQIALLKVGSCERRAGHAVPRRPETTPLYAVVHEHLETFLAQAAGRDRVVPRFVERELRAYLECGLLQFGFLRLRCEGWGHSRLLAFSCKSRSFRPWCMGRRMADTAAHLVDRVLPELPVRQWVLLLPHGLRYRLAYDQRLCSDVLGLFIRAVFGVHRRRARAWVLARDRKRLERLCRDTAGYRPAKPACPHGAPAACLGIPPTDRD